MLQFLRWATFMVIGCVIVGAAIAYPTLRERFTAPAPSAPSSALAPVASDIATTDPVGNASPPTQATATVPAATVSAVGIHAPSPTEPPAPNHATEPAATPTPFAIATTSLLPSIGASGNATSTPTHEVTSTVLGPTPIKTETSTPAQHTRIETTDALAMVGPGQLVAEGGKLPATPTAASGGPAPGQKGAAPPVSIPGNRVKEPTPIVVTPIVVTPIVVTPIVVTPIVVTTVEISPSTTTSDVTPIVVTTVELTPSTATPTPLPVGPTANTDSPLYGGPDFNAAIVGQVTLGTPLTIVGLYTQGTWYLLVNGQWIPGAAVNNAPLIMPLVFPTITPVPTNTATITPTPPPTETPPGAPTPTATPTSLEAAVCDCSGDTLDCLGNIFTNRTQAQQCFEYCFRQTGLDIHLLDPNLNGMACENLP